MEHDELAQKREEATRIINKNIVWCVGIGFIPFPLLDMVALTGIQVKMLAELAELYEVSFNEQSGKSAVGALIGGLAPGVMTRGMVGSAMKSVPLFGTLAGMVTMPVLAGATTYAVGRVFEQHFASGGTFLTFDPEKVREHYERMFEEGKKKALDVRNRKKKSK
ncbi:MAG: YcjF family protein [Desulfatibacillaceae bacterium]